MLHLITTTTASIKVSAKDLSPAQKKFNRLTKNLQRNKNLLKTWSETYDTSIMTYTQHILPLLQELDKLRLQALIHLDQCYNHPSLTKRQNDKLYNFIQVLTENCVTSDESGQAEEIYNRYNEMSFSESKKEHFIHMKAEVEDMLGISLGEDFDFESDSAFSDFMGTVKDAFEQKESKKQKKSKKTKTTANQKKQAESKHFESQSIKEVFRQLTKVLHPDREMDEKEKIRKSELMQRANISYKQQDLLSLLELQFEIEQANQATLDNLSNERLEAYSRLLQQQNEKIKNEIACVKQKISVEMNIPFFYNQPTQASSLLDHHQHDLEDQKKNLAQDLEAFSEIKSLKRWLNSLKIETVHSKNSMIPDDVFYF